MIAGRWNSTIVWLLRLQAKARLRRMLHSFSTPRRILLSSVGLLLAVVYLGQAAMSMWLREPMAPGRLRSVVPLGLLAYVLWDLLHVAWHRPKHGIRLRPAERQQLGMAPLERADLVRYRLLSIAAASVLKATVFCLVMVADLPYWPLSFLGAAFALAFIDQARVMVATTVEGMSLPQYRRFRLAVFLIATTAAASSMVIAYCSTKPLPSHSFVASVDLVLRGGQAFATLADTWIGRVLQFPLLAYGRLIAVDQITWQYGFAWIAALSLNFGMAIGLVKLDRFVQRSLRLRERERFRCHADQMAAEGGADTRGGFVRLPGKEAWTAVAWRQLHSARRYWPNLTLALAAPAGLSLMPLLLNNAPEETFLAIVGSVTFYTFLLLPAALKFDFRRDVDRIIAIKMLPLPPSQIVGAQLFAPWIVATVFHVVVVGIGMFMTGIPAYKALAALAILMPMSLLCFALDNLIFLMYPHRLREEGLVMFVRTTLTFTAKGLFFALSLAAIGIWAYASRAIAMNLGMATIGVFVAGLSLMLVLLNSLLIRLMISAFCHFDISWDRPA